MAKNSLIPWCDHTFNGWEGCTPVGPGCDNCYASARHNRFNGVPYSAQLPRRRTSETTWKQPLYWNRQAEKKGARYRVFCSSLGDVFDNDVPEQWRQDLFDLIIKTPHLDWLLLTKRIGNTRKMLDSIAGRRGALLTVNDEYNPPKNVWLGITVCNQEEAERDIPKLLRIPAEKRFLSIEPMLGQIDLTHLPTLPTRWRLPTLDWVIVGGETGPRARPMQPQWARHIRDQCLAAGVPFMFKQNGEWANELDMLNDGSPAHQTFYNNSAMVICEGCDQERIYRIGKKRAGHLLDGKEYMEVPS